MSVSDIDRRALRDQVYDRILERLLSGAIEPGERLSIDTMARDLAVSPTPVREAMVQLERTGLVTREALKGYRVAPPLDDGQLAELFAARLMLEVEAARLATAHRDEVLPGLREAHAAHEEHASRVIAAMAAGDAPVPVVHAYFDADNHFHRVVFAAAGNRYLQSMYDTLGALTHRLRQAVVRGATDVEEAHAEHAAILAAFESADGDPSAAMRAHIEHVRQRSLSDR